MSLGCMDAYLWVFWGFVVSRPGSFKKFSERISRVQKRYPWVPIDMDNYPWAPLKASTVVLQVPYATCMLPSFYGHGSGKRCLVTTCYALSASMQQLLNRQRHHGSGCLWGGFAPTTSHVAFSSPASANIRGFQWPS